MFIFSKVIFNFFCVGYIDGIPGGILTLYFVSIRPSFHYSVILLLCYFMSCAHTVYMFHMHGQVRVPFGPITVAF